MTTRARRVGLSAAGIAALVAVSPVVLPHLERWEGLEQRPYYDIVGVKTWCIGETRGTAKDYYSKAECREMASGAVQNDFGPAVLQCVPGLAAPERRNVLAASILLAYNIGKAGFCRSTAAKRFNAGDWRGGCNAFLSWRFAGGREIRGLKLRREDERALCLKGAG